MRPHARAGKAPSGKRISPVKKRRGKATITDIEQAKIDRYLTKKGATICPGALTPELAAFNKKRNDDWLAMTPEQRWKAGMQKHRPKKKSGITNVIPLEGDLSRRRNACKLPQTPARIKANAYAREYYARRRRNSIPDYLP